MGLREDPLFRKQWLISPRVRLRFCVPNRRLITSQDNGRRQRRQDLSLPEGEEQGLTQRTSCEAAEGQKSSRRSEPTANLTPAHGRRWGGNREGRTGAEARSRSELQGTWMHSEPISVHCATVQRLGETGLEPQTRSVRNELKYTSQSWSSKRSLRIEHLGKSLS